MDGASIGVGIIGAGGMAAVHAAAYGGIDHVRVVGVCGRDPQRARSLADACGAESFADSAALISHPAVDAIDVCVPSALHHAFVIPALARGKHVFCETPLALHLDEARRMRAAARAAGRLLQVGLLMRSVAAYAHIKEVETAGTHGRLLSLATYRLGSYLRADAADRKTHYSDPSTELMTFDFDVVGWVMGPPQRLSASAAQHAGGGLGEIAAVLAYGDGRQATVTASGMMPRGFPFSVGFRAVFERAAFELHTVFESGPPRSRFTMVDDGGPPRPVALAGRDPYQAELRHFVACIRGQGDVQLLDADRAIEALVLSLATQRALVENRTIDIEGLPADDMRLPSDP